MNNKSIKSEQINRESLGLNSVLIDEINKPDKVQDLILDEKHKIEILSQAIITEEAEEFKRKKEIQKVKKDSCWYRWCNCNGCCNNRDPDKDDYCDDIFWYWYWYWYFNNDNSYSNSENNDSELCDGNWCNIDSACDCDCDCDDD